MVVLEIEAIYAQAAPRTKLLNNRFLGAHHWLGPFKEALVARFSTDKVGTLLFFLKKKSLYYPIYKFEDFFFLFLISQFSRNSKRIRLVNYCL